MAWPRDDAKLDRVRALMGEQGRRRDRRPRSRQRPLPDELLGHEGVRRRRLPARGRADALLPRGVGGGRRAGRRGRPTCGSSRGTARTIRGRRSLRTLERAAEAAREHGVVGLELSLGTQASDRMVGEPTTFTKGWFDAFPDAVDATPLLAAARALKTAQEVERMRLANDIAAAAMDHVRRRDPPRDDRGADRRGVARASSTARGRAGRGRSTSRSGSRSSGRGRGSRRSPRRATGRSSRASRRSSRSGSAPTATGATTRRTSSSASCTERYRELEAGLTRGLRRRGRPLPARREPRRARPAGPRGDRADRVPGPAVASDLPRRRRAGARAAVRAPGRRRRRSRPGWFLQSSQDATGRAAAASGSRTTG